MQLLIFKSNYCNGAYKEKPFLKFRLIHNRKKLEFPVRNAKITIQRLFYGVKNITQYSKTTPVMAAKMFITKFLTEDERKQLAAEILLKI
jgi:hypothetical protein